MKKLYTLCFLPFCFAAQAQIRPGGVLSPDTTVSFSIAQTKVNVGNAGQNQNWDFSKVTFVDTAFARTFIPNSSTPGFSLFPTANLASTVIIISANGGLESSNSVGFIHEKDTYADWLGFYSLENGQVQTIHTHIPPQRISVSPFNYNDEFSYKINAKIENFGESAPPTFMQKGNGKTKYDAVGKIIFPNKSVAVNAARFKTTEDVFDTLVSVTEEYTYKTYVKTNNLSYTILDEIGGESVSIDYSKITTTNFIQLTGDEPRITTEITYDTSVSYDRKISLRELKTLATGIDEQQETLNILTAYPVPSTGVVSLNSNAIEFVEITDAKGVFVERQKYSGTITLPSQNGLYFIKAILPDGRYKNLKVTKE